MNFNLEAIDRTVDRYVTESNHTKLIARIGLEEFRNHVSCVFATEGYGVVMSPWISRIIPLPSNPLRVGFTPAYPTNNPQAKTEENLQYIESTRQELTRRSIYFVEAYGEALDFERAPGVFIAAVKTLADLSFVLNTQLSCLVVDANGQTQLKSLID